MPNLELKIDFPDSTSASANMLVGEMMISIDRSVQRQGLSNLVTSHQERNRTDTMDLGATLVLILGTPAVLAVAKGIHDFISKQQDRVVITTKDGTIVATGTAARNIDIAATVNALQAKAAAI